MQKMGGVLVCNQSPVALSFDGVNDIVMAPNSATGNRCYGSSGYSIEAWFYGLSSGENTQGNIVSKLVGSYAAPTAGFKFRVGTGRVLAVGFFAVDLYRVTSTTYTQSVWNHSICTWVSGDLKIFLNGVECAYSTANANGGALSDDSGGNLRIGNAFDTDHTFDGSIKCVRIYRNKALSPAEVALAYAAGRFASLPVDGCTAQYLFNEGSGLILKDSFGNHGTINGATWTKDNSNKAFLRMG